MSSIERFETGPRMSKIVRHGGLVYLCGQTARGTAPGDVMRQTEETLARIDGLLAQAGSDRTQLISVLIHLRSMQDFAAMNRVWEAWLPAGCAPARTTVEAALASPELLVEMTVVAALAQRR